MAKTYDKETAWTHHITIDKVVDMYECPDCGFEYNACQELDTDEGGYECPLCESLELEEENKRLRKALERAKRELSDDESVINCVRNAYYTVNQALKE